MQSEARLRTRELHCQVRFGPLPELQTWHGILPSVPPMLCSRCVQFCLCYILPSKWTFQLVWQEESSAENETRH